MASPECHREVPPLAVGVQPDIPEEEESCPSQQGPLGDSAGTSKQLSRRYVHKLFLTQHKRLVIPWDTEQLHLWW